HYRRTGSAARQPACGAMECVDALERHEVRLRAGCANDGNGVNWGTVQASGRISAKFQNVIAAPSGQRRPGMTCERERRWGREGLFQAGRQFSQTFLKSDERIPAASRFPAKIPVKIPGKIRRAALFCTTALAGAAIWVPAFAADTNWTGATSSDWFTATNWDTGAVPV